MRAVVSAFRSSNVLRSGLPALAGVHNAVQSAAVPQRAEVDARRPRTPHTVGDILHYQADAGRWGWVAADQPVFDAISRMTNHRLGCLMVVENPNVTSEHDAKQYIAFLPTHDHIDCTVDPGTFAEGLRLPNALSRVVGIVTERDYLTKVAVRGLSSHHTPVAQIMTPAAELKHVTTGASVMEALMMMDAHSFRNLPVMDVGVVRAVLSIHDVVRAVRREREGDVETIEGYLQGSY
ncbi:unnamed protein product [Pedinophyceae sp. YPF-701]|nr:unnamed protein product [Pedinophyceae sp. YPF-701]